MDCRKRAPEFLGQGPLGGKAKNGTRQHMAIGAFLHQADVSLDQAPECEQRVFAIKWNNDPIGACYLRFVEGISGIRLKRVHG